ncbi:hypothetical protein TNCV_3847421 [Trichonephila clavipes]|nr:hypothetical protein TNCV_3847421 [Trichonephila clavipes]
MRKHVYIILCAAKILDSLWVVYTTDEGDAALAMKFHFACRQSGCRMERYGNAYLAYMHLAFGAAVAVDELHSSNMPNVIPKDKLPASHQRLNDRGPFIMDTQEREQRGRTPNNEESLCLI